MVLHHLQYGFGCRSQAVQIHRIPNIEHHRRCRVGMNGYHQQTDRRRPPLCRYHRIVLVYHRRQYFPLTRSQVDQNLAGLLHVPNSGLHQIQQSHMYAVLRPQYVLLSLQPVPSPHRRGFHHLRYSRWFRILTDHIHQPHFPRDALRVPSIERRRERKEHSYVNGQRRVVRFRLP